MENTKETLLIVDDTAVCEEGDMNQIRYAINSGIADDIIFATLNAENVTRRAKAFNLI